MIKPKVVTSRVKIWRLGKDGFESHTATLRESILGADIQYDVPLPEKDYSAKCDVCLAQEQGFSCPRLTEAPGPYEFEGGCMDCQYLCRKEPLHIGIRNYCKDHIHIFNKKLGVGCEEIHHD